MAACAAVVRVSCRKLVASHARPQPYGLSKTGVYWVVLGEQRLAKKATSLLHDMGEGLVRELVGVLPLKGAVV